MKTKRSIQKEAIIEYLRSVDTHPTADEVYMKVRKSIPNISLGTVYRNLKRMTEIGEIIRITQGDSGDRFDGNPNPHYHFACKNCSRVYDIELPYHPNLDKEVSEQSGFEVHEHSIMFRGICKECKEKNAENNLEKIII